MSSNFLKIPTYFLQPSRYFLQLSTYFLQPSTYFLEPSRYFLEPLRYYVEITVDAFPSSPLVPGLWVGMQSKRLCFFAEIRV